MNKPTIRRRTPLSVAASLALAVSLLAGVVPAQMRPATSQPKAQKLTEEQRVLHVLNRLGFGARPGDVERVRRMGVGAYVEQQLRPEKLDDAAAEARLRHLEVIGMTTAQLYAKFPQPGQLLRALQRQGKLPADLQELAANRVKGAPAQAAQGGDAMKKPEGEMEGPMPAGEMMRPEGAPAQPAQNPNQQEYRQAIIQYMRENGMEPPQRITQELQASRILRAVYSERQLQESLVDFWTNHFNVFTGKGADRWLLVSYDRDTIRPNTLGKFRDLLRATAESPAMLFYLDNFQSVSPNAGRGGRRAQGGDAPARPTNPKRLGALAANRIPGGDQQNPDGEMMERRERNPAKRPARQPGQPAPQQRMRRGINENYARELMELHTLGVDGGYTQKDVQEVARCFTGWTIFAPYAGGGMVAPDSQMMQRAGTFFFNPRLHDDGEKTVLGHKIPAGGGVNDGLMVLDILSKHPSTAKFIATKLARKFVADDPSPALVARVAAAFTKSDGDIRETLRALFSSPEFNSAEAYRAKIKTPFELAVSAVRALGGETNGGPALHQWIARMGEPLYGYQAPTGYPDTAERWVNTGALLERINFALALVSNRVNGTRVDLARVAGDSARPGAAADKSRVIDQFAAVVLQGDISPRTKESLLKQLSEAATPAGQAGEQAAMNPPPPADDTAGAMDAPRGQRRQGRRAALAANAPVTEVARIAALILGSPEFQRQ